ncbi:MAG: hypothetical protein KGL52_14105 [Rhodospirillales bacterium]|nr:hypothetical protein [Rhodospirillales bacterium]
MASRGRVVLLTPARARVAHGLFYARALSASALAHFLWEGEPDGKPGSIRSHVLALRRARIETHVRPLMIRAGKLPITTPAGLYAKAAVLLSGYGAAPRLAQAIAASILEQPALRRILWPAEAPEAAIEPVPGLDSPPAPPEAANDPAPEPPPWKRRRPKGGA